MLLSYDVCETKERPAGHSCCGYDRQSGRRLIRCKFWKIKKKNTQLNENGTWRASATFCDVIQDHPLKDFFASICVS